MRRIELERIPQKSIRQFIKDQINDKVEKIHDLRSTYKKGDDLSAYLLHEESYSFEHDTDKVWEHYMKANPAKVWKGAMLSFGLMLSKADEEIMYVDGDYGKAEVGQVIYINLNIMKGFEVFNLD